MKKLILLLTFCFALLLADAKPNFRQNRKACQRAQKQLLWEHSTPACKDGLRLYRNMDGTRNMPTWYKIKKTLCVKR